MMCPCEDPNNCVTCLRADLAKAREDAKTDRLGVIAFQKALDTERSMRLAAERARDEARAEIYRVDRKVEQLRDALRGLIEEVEWHDLTGTAVVRARSVLAASTGEAK